MIPTLVAFLSFATPKVDCADAILLSDPHCFLTWRGYLVEILPLMTSVSILVSPLNSEFTNFFPPTCMLGHVEVVRAIYPYKAQHVSWWYWYSCEPELTNPSVDRLQRPKSILLWERWIWLARFCLRSCGWYLCACLSSVCECSCPCTLADDRSVYVMFVYVLVCN